jgi:hypothetical protein
MNTHPYPHYESYTISTLQSNSEPHGEGYSKKLILAGETKYDILLTSKFHFKRRVNSKN